MLRRPCNFRVKSYFVDNEIMDVSNTSWLGSVGFMPIWRRLDHDFFEGSNWCLKVGGSKWVKSWIHEIRAKIFNDLIWWDRSRISELLNLTRLDFLSTSQIWSHLCSNNQNWQNMFLFLEMYDYLVMLEVNLHVSIIE